MNRRDFLKLAASTGMLVTAPAALYRTTQAAPASDQLFVFVHAGGGWDPTSLCDPKGNAARADGRGPVNHYFTNQIVQLAGSAIRYAPFPDATLTTSTLRTDMPLISFDDFFTKYGSELLVINGIDTQTNSHSTGTRFVWSGILENMNQPAFAALYAGISAPTLPMAFLSNGGYDVTASLVAPTRAGGASGFQDLAFPNLINPDSSDSTFLADADYQLVRQAKAARLQRLIDSQTLPQVRDKMGQLQVVSMGDNNLDTLVQQLPEGGLSSGLKGQAEMAAAAFSAGLAVTANLTADSGFDTHGDHDRNQTNSLARLIDGVDHLMNELERQGLLDITTVLVGSDFGRTPYYNSGDGKDHWNVTSILAMGKGISGNRVIGATDENFEALALNAETLQPDANGIFITPGHIHAALRRLAGIENNSTTQDFPLEEEFINLFSV